MMKWFKKLFPDLFLAEEPKTPEKPIKIPVRGEVWYNKGDDSPWPKKDSTGVTIVDVKDGWVRYDFNFNIFKDQRLSLKDFLYCYRYYE